MNDKQILDRLKEILGSLYDPEKEAMYLRVCRWIEVRYDPMLYYPEPILEPLSQRGFEGIKRISL